MEKKDASCSPNLLREARTCSASWPQARLAPMALTCAVCYRGNLPRKKSEIAAPIMTTPVVATPTTASPSSNTTVRAANIPSTSRATTMPTGPSLAIRTKVTWPAELDTLLRGVGGQSFRMLFAEGTRLPCVFVHKTRAVRKLRLDTMSGTAQEVDAKTFVDRGLGCELTNLEVSGKRFCSLAFEAFPDDAAMHDAFARTVSAFLDGLQNARLSAAKSMSYAIWLGQFRM
jgi:hypothetical protein